MNVKGPGSCFEEVTLSVEEIKTTLFSLKGDKSSGLDEINYELVKQNLNSLLEPLKCTFDLSRKSGTFQVKKRLYEFHQVLSLATLH